MSATDQPSFVPATLRARVAHPPATATAQISWSDPAKVQVQVRIESGPRRYDGKHAWSVDRSAAARSQQLIAKLGSKRAAGKGPVALALEEPPSAAGTAPDEVAARDALVQLAHLHYSIAQTAFDRAQQLAGSGEADAAIDADRTGIAALGDRYGSAELIDDTQMKLIMANDALAKGRRAEGASLLHGVLKSRLGAYRELHQPVSAR